MDFLRSDTIQNLFFFSSENPFDYDENDLGPSISPILTKSFSLTNSVADMDSFCLAIQRELHEITAVGLSHP